MISLPFTLSPDLTHFDNHPMTIQEFIKALEAIADRHPLGFQADVTLAEPYPGGLSASVHYEPEDNEDEFGAIIS